MTDTPKPGSREATERGCTCPVMENYYGRGCMGDGEKYGWVYSGGCPLHCAEVDRKALEGRE